MPDPDEPLVTDLMLGTMIAFGADIVLILGFAWAAGWVSAALFATVTVLVVAFYGGWIGWRWRELDAAEDTERSPVEELKRRYANGELSEAEFERRLDTLIDGDDRAERAREPSDRVRERSK
jgi:uncharacterized membrane protein